MKISRDDLKGLIKECLVEILTESTVPRSQPSRSAVQRANESMQRGTSRPQQRAAHRAAPSAAKARSDALRDVIKRESGGDPILAGILADTAATTLPRMIEGDVPGHLSSVGGGDAASRLVAAHAPEQIFGAETTDKWAQLAFAPSRPGSSARSTVQHDT